MDRDLSKNDLSGEIPAFFADMKLLKLMWASSHTTSLAPAHCLVLSYFREIQFFFFSFTETWVETRSLILQFQALFKKG